MIIKICPVCNKKFEVDSKKKGRPQKYCSQSCRRRADLDKRIDERSFEKKCGFCGKVFIGNKKQKYCCEDCAKKANIDNTSRNNSYRWYNDEEYRAKKKESNIGTFNLKKNSKDIDDDDYWDEEKEIINQYKKLIFKKNY